MHNRESKPPSSRCIESLISVVLGVALERNSHLSSTHLFTSTCPNVKILIICNCSYFSFLSVALMWFYVTHSPFSRGLGRCPIVDWDFAGAVSIFGPDALPVVNQWLLPGCEWVRVAALSHYWLKFIILWRPILPSKAQNNTLISIFVHMFLSNLLDK